MKKFFKEWNDTPRVNSIAMSFMMFLGIIVLWIYINVQDPAIQFIAASYLSMITLIGIMSGIDIAVEKNKIFASTSWGDSKRIPIAALSGLVVMYVLTSNNFMLVPFSIVPEGVLNWFFVVIIAGWIEESFFRQTVIPTLILSFETADLGIPVLIPVILGNVLFAGFHFIAYGGNEYMMFVAFVMGMIWTFGNYYFKSSAFGQLGHMFNNLRVVGLPF